MLLSVHTVLQNRLCTFLPLSSCTVFDIIRLQLINKPISGNFPLPANSTLLLPHLLSALLNKKKLEFHLKHLEKSEKSVKNTIALILQLLGAGRQ